MFPHVGSLEPTTNQHLANRFDGNSLVMSQKLKQDQMIQYKDLTTHDKDHFQKHLSIKGLNHHHLKPQQKFSKSSLQLCLSMYTGLDVLDEDNKFICKACTDKKQCEFKIYGG